MKLIILLLSFLIISCSGSKSKSDNSESGIELADAVEFSDISGEDTISQDEDLMSQSEDSTTAMADGMLSEVGGEQRTYIVQNNETLMMISFKIYGDYRKWKELADLNREKLNGANTLKEGEEITYYAPAQEFNFNPEGNPYLIKNGDTLGTISSITYGTSRYWKNIWDNNQPLIRDPNIIFAGFTIYTPNIESRDVAFDDSI